MFTRDEAQKLAQKVIGFSTFPECQVSVSSSEQAYTRFANNGITTASMALRQSVSITVTRDSRTGVYGADDLDDASLREAVKKAEELAAIAPPNSERLPALGPQQYPRTFDYDDRTAKARAPEMIPHIKTIIDIALKKKLVAAGLIERQHSVVAIANKAGLFGFHESADSQLTTTIRMGDGSSGLPWSRNNPLHTEPWPLQGKPTTQPGKRARSGMLEAVTPSICGPLSPWTPLI